MTTEGPFQFNSALRGKEILRMCHVHGISPSYIEDCLRRDFLFVEPGSVDLQSIDIGQSRIMECPSSRLDDMFYYYVRGTSFARGKPLMERDSHIKR